MEISKDLGGGGGTSKNEGVIHSKVILVPQKILDKTSTFWPNALKILSKCIFQNWHKIRLLLHFHACYFSNNTYECNKTFFVVYLYFEFQIGQKPYWISLFFFALNYKQL